MKPLLVLAAFPVVLMGWASCSHSGTGHAALPDPRAVDKSVPEYKNPFHPSTYAHFVARKDYRKTYDVYKDDTLLNRQPKKSRKFSSAWTNNGASIWWTAWSPWTSPSPPA